ncbi:hypothetical protein SAY86_032033 [Trapa natans]|uniref:Oxidation resistance protein 1 n=1 Tax=Trapa natans TaxID=22666 RepID=A0AAN7M8H9_TRANT|nr:hypothetical protein SAY86_032033 [Trapa natans]
MGRKRSLRSKAAHFVSDLTTVFLNPISDKPSSKHHSPRPENVSDSKEVKQDSIEEDHLKNIPDGPDTSSFTAFLYSLLSSSEPVDDLNDEDQTDTDDRLDPEEVSSDPTMRGPGDKKSLLSRGRQSLGRAFTKIVGSRNQEWSNSDEKIGQDSNEDTFSGVEMSSFMNSVEPEAMITLPGISEPSLLLSEKLRSSLYASLPALVQGRKWFLLYSTWRHGISLSTLYRRSMLWPGLSLLVVGDKKGAIFGGLVEAPLQPTNKKKYQGTNSTFVFTTTDDHPNIFRPTGANRYYTLCSRDFLAIGGGGHFAIYLDNDLLSGSSSSSETYGNPCLAHSEDFEVKEVELWGFVYASKYDEMLSSSRTEDPGICRW